MRNQRNSKSGQGGRYEKKRTDKPRTEKVHTERARASEGRTERQAGRRKSETAKSIDKKTRKFDDRRSVAGRSEKSEQQSSALTYKKTTKEKSEKGEWKSTRRKTEGESSRNSRRVEKDNFERNVKGKKDARWEKSSPSAGKFKEKKSSAAKEADSIRLNKYIANAGFCSRREADTYIASGVVTVNGEVITELGYKIKPGDKVLFGGRPVIGEKPVYILLNKPKDYITTSKDPQNRKTIFDLLTGVKERVFSVGRLDRNTTGLLLLTNDGILADKLMHPRRKVVKIYHVELDRKVSKEHLDQLMQGVELEDGFFAPDVVSPVEGMDKKHIGIEIHSGKYRIVRRLFEHFGYRVVKLDRVFYGGLTKKGLTRGHWRYLELREIGMLNKL